MNSSYAGDALSRLARDVQESLDTQRAKYMYQQQGDAQNAKRNAIENLQNRNTFGYEQNAPEGQGGFDISKVLGSIDPKMLDSFGNKGPEAQSLSRGAPANNSFSIADFGTAR